MFSEELIYLNEDFSSQEEVLEFLSDKLATLGLVKDDFYQNIKERETIFPTGLRIGKWGIAIPHTDSIYVNRSQIAYVSLIKPVIFQEMGNSEAEVSVTKVFMLALKEAHEQLDILQKLIELFQSETYMNKLDLCSTVNEVKEVLYTSGLINK